MTDSSDSTDLTAATQSRTASSSGCERSELVALVHVFVLLIVAAATCIAFAVFRLLLADAAFPLAEPATQNSSELVDIQLQTD